MCKVESVLCVWQSILVPGSVCSLILEVLCILSLSCSPLHQITVKLDLRGNDIQTLPSGAFKHTPYLTHLALQRCNIRAVREGAFRGLGRLVFLNLAHNNIDILYQVCTHTHTHTHFHTPSRSLYTVYIIGLELLMHSCVHRFNVAAGKCEANFNVFTVYITLHIAG